MSSFTIIGEMELLSIICELLLLHCIAELIKTLLFFLVKSTICKHASFSIFLIMSLFMHNVSVCDKKKLHVHEY